MNLKVFFVANLLNHKLINNTIEVRNNFVLPPIDKAIVHNEENYSLYEGSRDKSSISKRNIDDFSSHSEPNKKELNIDMIV